MTPATAPATLVPDSTLSPSASRNASALVSLVCSTLALIMGLSYVCFRSGFENLHSAEVLRSIALAVILLSSPPLLREILKKRNIPAAAEAPILAATLGCLVLLGCITSNFFGALLIPSLAIVGLFGIFRQLPSLTKQQWLVVAIGSTILGLWFASYVFGFQARDPLTLELRATHTGGADALFHMALVQNLNTYGVISTGLNGVPVLHYHAASHWMFSRLANLLGESPVLFYMVTFPIVFVPLFVKAFFAAIDDLRSIVTSRWTCYQVTLPTFWLGAFLVLAGCIPFEIRKISAGLAWGQPFASESHTTGLILSMLGLSTLICLHSAGKRLRWLIPVFAPLCLMLLTGTKVSWLLVGTLGLGVLFIRERGIRSAPYTLAIPLAVAGAYYINLLSRASDCQGGVKLSIGDSLKNFAVPGHNWEFVVFYFLPVWALIAITIIRFGYRSLLSWNRNSTAAHAVLAIWIALFAFTNLVELEGAAALYFLDPLRWMALIAACAIIPAGTFNALSRPQAVSVIAATSLLLCWNMGSEIARALARNADNRLKIASLTDGSPLTQAAASPQAALNRNPTYKFLQHLTELQNVPVSEKRQTLLFIPQSCSPYWSMSSDKYGPFMAPALSGIAMLDGMPPAERTPAAYGYDGYKRRKPNETQQVDPAENLKRAQSMGFTKLRVLDWQNNGVMDRVYAATSN